MQLIQGITQETKWHLVKASFEHDVVITPPSHPYLETTREFSKKHQTIAAINTNFFRWIPKETISDPTKALAWYLGKTKDLISAHDLRRTLSGVGCIPSYVQGAYWYAGTPIRPCRSGTFSINLIPGRPPKFRLGTPLHPFHVIEGFTPLLYDGAKIRVSIKDPSPPRTVLGCTKTHYLLFVSDGRGNGGSKGISFETIQELLLHHGALYAAGLDGGESSSLIYRSQQLAHPCDPHVALATLPNPLSALALLRKTKTERPVGLNLGLR